MPNAGALTDKAFWNEYWRGVRLPAEVRKTDSAYIRALTDALDRLLPPEPGLRALEIGGAPGQYLAYLAREKGYRVTVLDNSSEGCVAARRNFELLGLEGTVIEADMFDPPAGVQPADIVYSLGLIEHFDEVEAAIGAHLQFLAPGGILLVGCPNFLGLTGFLLRRLAPGLVRTTNPAAMDVRRWQGFERRFGLRPLFRGYVGGFEPRLAARYEGDRRWRWLVATTLARFARVLDDPRTAPLRRLNSRYWSGYVLGVWTRESR